MLQDPYFEEVPAKNLLGRPSNKKRKKATPEGLSKHDAKVLTKVKRRAYRLDLSLCNFCGIKFGWSSVIALFPAYELSPPPPCASKEIAHNFTTLTVELTVFVHSFGDAIDAFLALLVVMSANKVEGRLPGSVLFHMLFNVFLDFAIGLLPFVGDLADAMYKCNTRNAVLLEKFLKQRAKTNLKRANNPAAIRDESETGHDIDLERGIADTPRYASPSRPEPARLPSGAGKGSKRRDSDIEMGVISR